MGAIAAAPPPRSGGVVDEDDDYTSLGVFLVGKEAFGHDGDQAVVAMAFGIKQIEWSGSRRKKMRGLGFVHYAEGAL